MSVSPAPSPRAEKFAELMAAVIERKAREKAAASQKRPA